jgi:hypothetical protein
MAGPQTPDDHISNAGTDIEVAALAQRDAVVGTVPQIQPTGVGGVVLEVDAEPQDRVPATPVGGFGILPVGVVLVVAVLVRVDRVRAVPAEHDLVLAQQLTGDIDQGPVQQYIPQEWLGEQITANVAGGVGVLAQLLDLVGVVNPGDDLIAVIPECRDIELGCTAHRWPPISVRQDGDRSVVRPRFPYPQALDAPP